MYEAKQTIDRIKRGHFRIHIIQHGDGGANREVQVVDTVHGFLVKGVTEQDMIAHILLDPRTAAKHFEPVKVGTELKREADRRDPKRITGLQRVLKENKGIMKPKSAKKAWPTLRLSKSAEQIQRECDAANEEDAQRDAEKAEDVGALVAEKMGIVEAAETSVREEVEPDELAALWQFEDESAEGLFVAVAMAVGTIPVEDYLDRNQISGVLCNTIVDEMASVLSEQHEASRVEVIDEEAGEKVEIIPEKKRPAKRKAKTKAKKFVPK